MRTIYLITLRQLAGRWRLLIVSAVAVVPVLITLLILSASHAPSVADYENNVLGGLLAGAVAPLVVLTLAGAALGNEIEDGTLLNLVLAPLDRWKIVLAKLLAAITIAAPFIGASAFVTGYLAFVGDWTATLAITFAALGAVVLYSAAFLWLGAATSHAFAIGLLYIVVWEGFLAGFITGVRMLSIRYHAAALAHAFDARRFQDAVTQPAIAVFVALALLGAFFMLTDRKLRRMDVP